MADQVNCKVFTASQIGLCESIVASTVEHDDKLESLQDQIYIIAGVGGGIALVLIVTLIVLAVQLSRLRQRATIVTTRDKHVSSAKKLSKSFEPQSFPSSQQQSHHHHQSPPPTSYAQPQKPGGASADDELAQLGFSAYTGHPTEPQRGFSPTSPAVNSAGGVRVLPRNPPPGFRQNANAGYNNNDGYM